MELVTLNELLSDARKKKYAVPAFDVSNYEMVRTVLEVCDEMHSPVILMALKQDLAGRGLKMLTELVKAGAETVKIPICLHLDHANDFALIQEAVSAGFTSVMYDGSVLPFASNVENTKRVVSFAHEHGVSVEAELGHVGDAIAGTEDTVETCTADNNADEGLTDVNEVAAFVEQTNVDALAVAIGTAHGVYKHDPVIRHDRLAAIDKICRVPLVLHGGSGNPDGDIKKAVALGITKINIYSELLYAMNTGLKDKLNSIQNLSMWPVYVYEVAIKRMRDVVRDKITLLGSAERV